MKFELPVCIFVSILLTAMVFNFFTGGSPMISRIDGMILLVCFGLFMWYSFHRDRKAGKTEEEAPAEEDRTPFWLAVVKVVGGLAVLITSCDFFVDNAVLIAKSFGVNDAFISLTLIACGTSLPELAASVAAALKKNTQLALGNVIGSNIFNITWILGLSSQVMPLNSSGITGADYCVMVAAALLPVIIGFKGKIGRAGGALLFIGFLAYNWYLISNQIV
jgi:cation:H+ antiporter